MGTLAWIAALSLAAGTPDDPTGNARDAAGARLLVPAYFDPNVDGRPAWDRLLASAARVEIIAIVNPASGPGRRVDPAYEALLERAAGSKLIPIGYVTTSYARRPLEEVKAEVDRWLAFYPGLQGIFFDEQASGAEHVDYQAELYAYVRERRGLQLVVTNPGTVCDEAYLARPAADVVCLFEGPREPESLRLPAWIRKYGPARIAALPYRVADAEAMRACVREAAERGIGTLYVTDAGGRNPWDRLPTYWDEEVAASAMPVGRGE